MGFPSGPNGVDLVNSYNTVVDTLQNELKTLADDIHNLAGADIDAAEVADVAEGTAAVPFGLAALPDLAFACAAFMVLWIANWTLLQVATWLTNLSILGVHPFSFLTKSWENAAANLDAVFEGVASRVRALAVTPFHMVNQVLIRIHNALNAHQGNFRTITTATIPQAQSNAEAYTRTQLAATATSLQNNINVAVSQEAHDVKSLQDNIDALTNYVNGPFLDTINDLIRTAQGNAEAYSHAQLVQVETDLVNRLAGDEATLSGVVTEVNVTVPAEIAAAVKASYDTEQANLVSATQSLQGEINDIEQQIAAANARIDANVNAIAANVQAIEALQVDVAGNAAAIAAAQQAITTAEDDIKTNTDELATLNTQLTATQAQLQTTTDNQTLTASQLAPIGLAAGATIASAVATIGANLAALTTEFENCAVTSCDGPNNLSNLLQTLLGLADFAVFAEFINSALKDPAGEAASVESMGQDLYTAGDGLLDSLLSL